MKVKILGINYKIEKYSKDQQHDGSLGAGNSRLGVLRVCKNMPSDVQQSTLLHEIIHQVSEKTGCNLTEGQVLSLESGLFPFFKHIKI